MAWIRSRRALVCLTALLAALALALWIGGDEGSETPVSPALRRAASAGDGVEASASASRLAALAPEPGSPSDARLSALDEPRVRELPPRRIGGLVVIPEGASEDPTLTVVVRAVGGGRVVKARAPVDRSGTFSFVVPASVRHATLDLDGEHLFLARPARIALSAQAEAFRLEAHLGGCLVVRITALDGRVISDAIGSTIHLRLRSDRDALVDAEGRARFAGLPPGAAGQLVCDVPGFVQAPSQELPAIEPGVTHELDLVVARAASLAGRVLDARGFAVEGAGVFVGEILSESGVDGSFELGGLYPGDVSLSAIHPTLPWTHVQVAGLREGELRRGLDLRLDDSRSIGGRVVWPDHSPAVGAWVRVEGRKSSSAFTDSEGRFELRGLGQGPYTLAAFSREPISTLGSANPVEIDPGGPRARLGQVTPDDMNVLLVLEPGTSLRGHVLDESGQVLRGARVVASLVKVTAVGYSLQTSSALTDGSFQLDLPPGTYDLTARGKAGPGETRRVEVSQQVSGVVLVAPR